MLIRTHDSKLYALADKVRHPIAPPSIRIEGRKTAPEAHVVHERKADETRKPVPPEARTTPVAVKDHMIGEAPKKTPPPEPRPVDKRDSPLHRIYSIHL